MVDTLYTRDVLVNIICLRDTCVNGMVNLGIIIIHIYIAHYSHCALMRFLKNTVIPLLNTHRSYTLKKSYKKKLNIVMESALWIFCGSSFHNLAAEVPKKRFPNRMDLFLYGTSDVNTVDCKDLLGM